MNADEFFVLCAAFRYAQGRHTDAIGTVVSYICKQFDRMSTANVCELLLEIERRRKYGEAWGFQEEEQVDKLEKRLRDKYET